jgi:hypothetical protein
MGPTTHKGFGKMAITHFLKYFTDAGAAGSTLLLSLLAALTWLFQKYLSYITTLWVARSQALENAKALSAEIGDIVHSLDSQFGTDNEARAKKIVTDMHRKKQHLLLVVTDDKPVFDAVKSEIKTLPTPLLNTVLAFYARNDEHLAGYRLQSTKEFESAPLDRKLDKVKDYHDDARVAASVGRKAMEQTEGLETATLNWQITITMLNLLLAVLAYNLARDFFTW